MIDRSFRAKVRYRSDEFLSGGAGRQLFALFMMTMALVVLFTLLSYGARRAGLEVGDEGWANQAWFYFTRLFDAGTMSGDAGNVNRLVSTTATVAGIVVAGLLISSLAGNFQERLEAIKSEGSPVMEQDHFLILGWSEKVPAIIDQLSEANIERGKIVVVVMAERPKADMEAALRDKIQHQDRIKLVVRSGSSVVLGDLSKVAFELARAIVVLVDDSTLGDVNRADGRVIKTLMALYNHPDGHGRIDRIRVTSEVMLPENAEIAAIASNRKAQVITTNDIISRIILQTARISGLSLVYDELLRFEGNEIHYSQFPQVTGRRFGDILLDFPNGCVVGVAKADGSAHTLNPPADHVIAADEELLVLAEDDHIQIAPYGGPLAPGSVGIPSSVAQKPVERMLILGWNEKIFPILQEFDTYVGKGSVVTLVNVLPEDERKADLEQKLEPLVNLELRHVIGDFTNRQVLEQIEPHTFPTVMVLGDSAGGGSDSEAADTRAIIALLLLRDFRLRAGVESQEVCSEILDPRNRDLAATTQIHDIVISNEMVSMVLAQITHEPRVRPVLEDLFSSEGSEIYLKDLALYVQPGQAASFEQLILAAKARGEVALGVQVAVEDPRQRYGIVLNPKDRKKPITPKAGDRLIVLAEDDG